MRRLQFAGILCTLGMLLFSQPAFAEVITGDIAPNFTLVDYVSGEPVSLYDFEGHIIVLDFFAYWCGPCKNASSELEPYVQEYYENLGGNPDGIPVTLLSISIDHNQTQVDNYINTYGLDIALNDDARSVYNLYQTVNSIPQFRVINGADSENYDKWEVIYDKLGYSISTTSPQYIPFRSKINSVKAAPIPGDANKDGKVDGTDVSILSSHWQQESIYVPWSYGDFNGDHKVDGSDVTILAANWQYGVTTAAATVPEPSTIVLLFLGMGMLLMARFTKRHS